MVYFLLIIITYYYCYYCGVFNLVPFEAIVNIKYLNEM